MKPLHQERAATSTQQSDSTSGSGAPGATPPTKAAPADIGFVGLLRWAWRQLTTMRAALILLLMLALAIIPASLLPQRIQDPARVASFIEDNGQWGEVLDTFQLFDVHSSVWFASIYILLMVSLVGCILPRTRQHLRAMRQEPPKAPRRLTRMPGYASFGPPLGTSSKELLDAAERLLKKRGYRTVRHPDHIAAERGYLRETGNLVFHAALLGMVITMGVGSLFGYSGQRVLVEGDTFTNSLVAYDSFEPGPFFDPARLQDFRLRLDSFEATFDDQAAGNQFGQPRTFEADVTEFSGGQETQHLLRVNEPIRVGGAGVYLLGNGYAPHLTVRDAAGNVTHSGAVVFLPQDGVYTSRGVLKVPDATPDQLGFVGILLPTVGQNDNGELVSTFADLRNPYLVMSAYRGNLGLDEGIPQSVYELDADNMTELTDATGAPPGDPTQPRPDPAAARRSRIGDLRSRRPVHRFRHPPRPHPGMDARDLHRPDGRARPVTVRTPPPHVGQSYRRHRRSRRPGPRRGPARGPRSRRTGHRPESPRNGVMTAWTSTKTSPPGQTC